MKYLGRSVLRVLGIWAFKGRLPHDCDANCLELGHRFRHNFKAPQPFLYRIDRDRLLATTAFPPPKRFPWRVQPKFMSARMRFRFAIPMGERSPFP
jgi:hypothetical protein